ncbi:MAG: tripartite tricarboxylate transporter permease, partial [Rhodobacteraceae bacterium]|nr:tripartite tricarboxylate transporter permease [Paracoccaceae bacterium]
MEVLSLLADGFATSLSPFNLFIVIIGVTAGLFIGAMPGLGSVNGVAILLPFTFVIQGFTGGATSPMIFLASIYY